MPATLLSRAPRKLLKYTPRLQSWVEPTCFYVIRGTMRIKSAGGELKIRFDPANPTPPAQVLFVKENKLFALAKLLPGSFKPSDDPGMVRVKYSSVQWLTNKEPRT